MTRNPQGFFSPFFHISQRLGIIDMEHNFWEELSKQQSEMRAFRDSASASIESYTNFVENLVDSLEVALYRNNSLEKEIQFLKNEIKELERKLELI